jgi:hypothetical protein
MSARTSGLPLWLIRWPGNPVGTLFAGTLAAMVAHINALHLATGLQHRATEVG